ICEGPAPAAWRGLELRCPLLKKCLTTRPAPSRALLASIRNTPSCLRCASRYSVGRTTSTTSRMAHRPARRSAWAGARDVAKDNKRPTDCGYGEALSPAQQFIANRLNDGPDVHKAFLRATIDLLRSDLSLDEGHVGVPADEKWKSLRNSIATEIERAVFWTDLQRSQAKPRAADYLYQ